MITEIFYHTDNFCKELIRETGKNILTDGENKRDREFNLSMSEIMTIAIYYHFSGYNTFKDYYTRYVLISLKDCFKKLVSYSRFVELKEKITMPLAMFAKILNSKKCSGIFFIDSFSLPVCNIRRSKSNKTFKNSAKKGKTSVGWFFGFKVHIIINPTGEIVNFCITKGNVSDNNKNVLECLTENIEGKVFGDKGYMLNKKLFEQFLGKKIKIVTKIRKNMKNQLLEIEEKLILTKRGLVESVINIIKRILLLDNTRHRSPLNFLSNIFSSLVAYGFREGNPSLDTLSNDLICKNC